MRYAEVTRPVGSSVNMTMMQMHKEAVEKYPTADVRIVSHCVYTLLDRNTYLSIIFSLAPKS
jgi:hypothetical protein